MEGHVSLVRAIPGGQDIRTNIKHSATKHGGALFYLLDDVDIDEVVADWSSTCETYRAYVVYAPKEVVRLFQPAPLDNGWDEYEVEFGNISKITFRADELECNQCGEDLVPATEWETAIGWEELRCRCGHISRPVNSPQYK